MTPHVMPVRLTLRARMPGAFADAFSRVFREFDVGRKRANTTHTLANLAEESLHSQSFRHNGKAPPPDGEPLSCPWVVIVSTQAGQRRLTDGIIQKGLIYVKKYFNVIK